MDKNDQSKNNSDIPDHLKRGSRLYVRQGVQIAEAPAEDRSVAQKYPRWQDKGAISDGKRLTILTQKNTYKVSEEIRIIHVFEVTEPGHEVYVMGPKPVYGEYVDNQLATQLPPNVEEPWIPLLYDGAVLQSPAVDYNYEITSYSFPEPGSHNIYWQLGTLQSNILTLEVTN